MNSAEAAFKAPTADLWTPERLDRLDRSGLENLLANATRLGEQDLAARCAALLKERPQRGPARGTPRSQKATHDRLVPRSKAFQARGVWLQDPRTSWSGVRKPDNVVVMAIWRAAIQSRDGGCACLLWAPNVDGKRPWSDSAAGRERLEHCKIALRGGAAEGLLVHGEAIEGRLPEDQARTVLGVDPESFVRFRVEEHAGEYWALWGTRSALTLSHGP